jgi:glycosyltransferase involved in cell wall biosynthesis
MASTAESQSDSPPALRAAAERLGAGAVIPAYNPGPELGPLLDELDGVLGKERVVVIDDGSEHGDFASLEAKGFTVLHVVHGGKGWALQQGFTWARERGWLWAITMDADGQHAPGDLPGFLDAIERGGGDLLLGNRMEHVHAMPWLRRLTNWSTSWVIAHMAGQRIPDAQSGYRAVRLAILDAFSLVTKNFDMESEILMRASWAGFRIVPVPIQTIYRGGESHISKRRDTLRFLRLMRSARRWRRG